MKIYSQIIIISLNASLCHQITHRVLRQLTATWLQQSRKHTANVEGDQQQEDHQQEIT